MSRSAEFWRKRAEQDEVTLYNVITQKYESIEKEYFKSLQSVEGALNKFYNKLDEVSMAEAKKQVDERELRYFNKRHNSDYKKLSNLKATENEIRLSLDYFKQYNGRILKDALPDIYKNSRELTLYELALQYNESYYVSHIDDRKLLETFKRGWNADGTGRENYLSRLETMDKRITDTLQTELSQNILTGKPAKESIDNLVNTFGMSERNARRLFLTEAKYYSTVAALESMREMGVENFEFVATLDAKTCEICGSMDGEVFAVSSAEIGVNAPPLHPNDRCVIVAKIDYEMETERIARGADNKSYYVPSDTTYEEWRDAFVNGKDEEFLKKSSLQMRDSFEKRKTEVNLKIDNAVLTFANKYVNQFNKDFPTFVERAQPLRRIDIGQSDDMLAYYKINDNAIFYNGNYAQSWGKINKQILENIKDDNFYPNGSSANSLFAHEYTHYVTAQIARILGDSEFELSFVNNLFAELEVPKNQINAYASNFLGKMVYYNFDKNDPYFEYKRAREIIAESVAQYRASPKVTPLARKIHSRLARVIRNLP